MNHTISNSMKAMYAAGALPWNGFIAQCQVAIQKSKQKPVHPPTLREENKQKQLLTKQERKAIIVKLIAQGFEKIPQIMEKADFSNFVVHNACTELVEEGLIRRVRDKECRNSYKYAVVKAK
jgi:hypothetical protein